MSDSEEYLQPGFDARSLTMPRLRSVLVAHNVSYPATAKKAQLVEIFNESIVPQAKKILDRRAKAKRSSKGISDAERGQSIDPFAEQEDLAPPPSVRTTRRSQSPRKTSMRIKSEEPDHAIMPPARSPSKRQPRASSRQLQPPSDTETGPEPEVARRSRSPRKKLDVVPQLKAEQSDEFFRRTSGMFTSDNPFQSGSSPPSEVSSSRRRTAGHETSRPTSSSSTRRRTHEPAYHEPAYAVDTYDNTYDHTYDTPAPAPAPAPVRLRPQTPVSRVVRRKTPELTPESMVEAGEEFTVEEQLELAAEEAATGQAAMVPRQTRPPPKANWGTSLTVMAVTALSVFAGWYRQEKIAIGYCGVGQPIGSVPTEITVPEWAQSVLPPEIEVPQFVLEALEPVCESCPAHAYCSGGFTVQCEADYILKPHPLSLGGFVPLSPTCEPDGEKARRVKAVADKAVEELRERTARFECGELVNEEGAKPDSPAIEEQDLKETINQKRSKKLNNREFEDLWGSALGEVKDREEVEVKVEEVRDSRGVPNTYLSSTSLARVPIRCAVKRSVRLGLARYRLQISTLISFVLTAIYARRRYLSNKKAKAQVPALVNLVLERLANQKQLGDDIDDPWLFLPNLRDDVLRSIHSLSQREKIWQRVRAVVEQNSNVRTSQREGRSGEVGRAWEWIGPTAGDSARQRRSGGRVSFGPDVKSETSSPGEEKSYLHQKWEEGRPIY
ncbi:sister chromatid separation protein [Apiospora kogelbergensis]|uniref:sister chromatid separation protein n=1 Tax=Apiospora kogelbergensis TaxID=1337665 RepID=UPI00312F45EF